MICYSFEQAVAVTNLGEFYQRFKSNIAEGKTLEKLDVKEEYMAGKENRTFENILNEKEYNPTEVSTITYIVSNKDNKTILATLKNEDDWKEYKSRHKKTEEVMKNQVETNIKDSRKGKFVLLDIKQDAKPNLTAQEENIPKEKPEKKLATVSPEDWLAQFYSTDTKYQKNKIETPQPATQRTEQISVTTEITTTGKVIQNFEQLLLKPILKASNSLEKVEQSGNRINNERRPVRKSDPVVHLIPANPKPVVHLIPANPETDIELISHSNRRQSSIASTLPSQTKSQVSWRSSDSNRWRPVFSPSQKEERRLRL